MPQGGSKKGENRGYIKRRILQTSSDTPRKRGPKKGGPSNNPAGRPKGGKNKATLERLEMLSKELGIEHDEIMPMQILLKISRIFWAMGQKDMEAIQAGKVDPTLFADMERHMVLAGDHAYKAAAFYHPRLTAAAIAPMGGLQSGEDVLQQLLNEIDGRARQARTQAKQIEHRVVEAQVLAAIEPYDDEDDGNSSRVA